MQLMSATAHWLARKLGMKRLSEARISDRNTSIVLGTNDLKLVLASLDDLPVLGCAAYNAGPGRAKRWRGARALEGAIYGIAQRQMTAIEALPESALPPG